MKPKINDAKLIMLEHSKAKVELYTEYLSTYLMILSRVPFIKKIHLYDLMCGEGVYLDNSKGSPIVAMQKVKDHYFKNNKTCPNMRVWFNDKDKSEIELDKYKIERVKNQILKMFVPTNVDIEYTKEDFQNLLPKIKQRLKNLINEKALLFIDPYGYKEVNPVNLKDLLSFRNTEIILFLPISFMYRFVNKTLLDIDFQGGEALRNFLEPLLKNNNNLKIPSSVYDFINQLKISFRDYLKQNKILVDTFTLQRDVQNVYCLFFFTPNELGFEKMLETKWKLDEQHGKGFKISSSQQSLFSEVEVFDYLNEVKSFISTVKFRTNSELYHFGLVNGFLPKHTNLVLREIQNTMSNFKVYLIDGKLARKGAYYIKYENFGANPKKLLRFKFVNHT